MEPKIIKDIISFLKGEEKEHGNFIIFDEKGYSPEKINIKNFHKIDKIDLDCKIAFVDGGNAEILRAAHFSLQIVQVYYSVYQNNKRIEQRKIRFYALIKSSSDSGKIIYSTKTFGDSLIKDFVFDSLDKTLMQGNIRADISSIGGILRRFAEIKAVESILKDFSDIGIVVIDGSLESHYTHEDKLIKDVFSLALEKNAVICGFSKTCGLLTDKGMSAISAIEAVTPYEEWYYWPIGKFSGDYDVVFCRLHKNTKHSFRLDLSKNLLDINKIVGLLRDSSKDPVFLGYPYGLVHADKLARVSNQELHSLKTEIMAIAGKDWKDIQQFLKTKDSHQILDNIGY